MQHGIEVTFDDKAKTAYVRFSRAKVAKTTEFAKGDLFIDLDHEGNIVGIEVLAPGTLNLLLHATPQPFVIPPIPQARIEQIDEMLAAM